MPAPIHLVLGDHGASLLRQATRFHDLPGTVHAIPDDLSHGPLSDGRRRLAYMRDCWQGFGEDWPGHGEDAFEAWQALQSALEGSARPVVVWRSESVQDHVFLRMAAWWLRSHAGPLLEIQVPARGERIGVGVHEPFGLAALALTARALADDLRAALAQEFAAIRERPESVRRWRAGQLEHLPSDIYDELLLHDLARDWQPAARIVGRAMHLCDPRNPMTDLFFSARLQALIAAGRIDAEGDRDHLRGYRVRRR